MPNTLSPRDQINLLFDSLLYAANRTFMLEETQRDPHHGSHQVNRRDLVDQLRRHIPRNVQVPPSHSTTDRELYAEMLSLIRAWRTSINERVRDANKQDQQSVADGVVTVMYELIEEENVIGCGDLCYDKERGCVECPPQQ